jgi:lipid-A-disaccharide synthase
MVVVFPFEESLYRQAGVQVFFVGHPCMDAIVVRDQGELARRLPIDLARRPLVGLLPGSRQSEVKVLLPIMLDAASLLARTISGIRFVLPLASTIGTDQVRPLLKGRDLPLTVLEHRTHEAIQACDLIVAASGSVTLEAAILRTPLVVVYKVHPLTFGIGRRLVHVRHLGLVNLVAGEEVAPELIQGEARAERIAEEVVGILRDPDRQRWIRSRLADVRRSLGAPGASTRAAEIALSLMGGSGGEGGVCTTFAPARDRGDL